MRRVTLSEKGQISIPASIRQQFGLRKGDKLLFEEVDGAIIIRPVPEYPLLTLKEKHMPGEDGKIAESLLKERRYER